MIYVEDDPALRGVFGSLLGRQPELELLGSFATAQETLESSDVVRADVALLDHDLGPHSLTGSELGLLLRERNPHIGIVIFTQHVVADFVSSLPEETQWGWSFVEKRSNLDLDQLVSVLQATAQGLSVLDPGMQQARAEGGVSIIDSLTQRQREVLALAATGLDANAIAEHLGLASVTVRQELSRAYAVLVPEPKKGTDLRTSAVLRYLRESRNYGTPFLVPGLPESGNRSS